MKLITPLWSDPVGWSEQVAKTKLRVVIWSVIHLGGVAAAIAGIYWTMRPFLNTPSLFWAGVVGPAALLVFIGVLYPTMYLYAMHRLLLKLKAKDKLS